MRCVVQRVAHASVTVNEQKIAAIGAGYLVLVGVEDGDGENDMIYCADKIAGLRIFEDENGKMNLSIEDVGGEVLLVSQFTLLGDARLNAYNPLFCREAFAPFAADEVYTFSAPGDLEVCGMAIRVIPTPGHTPGGVCYHLPEYNALFSGDTLFADGYGRTDLPGGSMAELAQSLKALRRLPGEDAI